MDDEYILIGWMIDFSNPIIVPKNVQWDSRETQLNLSKFLRDKGRNGANSLYIILPQLYKLENIRNLDLYDDLMCVIPLTLLVDNNCNTILKGRGLTPSCIQTKDEYYDINKTIIREIHTDYPGLIKKVYLNDGLPYGPLDHPSGGKRSTTKRHIKTRKSNTKKNK